MEPIYDLFSRLPNGSPLWLESIEGLEIAEKRMDVLARLHPSDEYFIYSEKCGGVVRRIPDEEHPPTGPENHSWL
jgi:hypothetical protein